MTDRAPEHPEIRRIVAPNPGPMTLEGTNTFLIELEGHAFVIDPGPADPDHLDRVRAAGGALGGIAGILLTHGHGDHAEGAGALGAPVLWPTTQGEDPSKRTAVGPFEAVPTPGHSPDHVVFLLGRVCFCGDLVLGEGSSFVPPDGGSLAAYLESLRRVRELGVELLCPGHGPWITDPKGKLDEYLEHRLDRERKLLAALERGERSRAGLLASAWDDVPPELRGAAAAVMQAHLEKLETDGRLPDDLRD